jgi:hypothetical protein
MMMMSQCLLDRKLSLAAVVAAILQLRTAKTKCAAVTVFFEVVTVAADTTPLDKEIFFLLLYQMLFS